MTTRDKGDFKPERRDLAAPDIKRLVDSLFVQMLLNWRNGDERVTAEYLVTLKWEAGELIVLDN